MVDLPSRYFHGCRVVTECVTEYPDSALGAYRRFLTHRVVKEDPRRNCASVAARSPLQTFVLSAAMFVGIEDG